MRLGAELPFAAAADLLARCTGTRISAATVRRLTVAGGQTLRQLELDFTATVEAGTAAAAAAPREPLQLSVDGSMVPLVGGEWREVRVAAIGRLAGWGAAPRATGLSYAATLGSAEAFGREALGEVHRRGVDRAATVVAVSDGAPWIQGFLDLHAPGAVRVLDFAHAAGYLAQAAQAAFGCGTAATGEWFAGQRHELRHGDPERVLAALAALPASEERDGALRYLGERRAMIAYRTLSAAGWPIGSGCVESAHKTVLQARLKRGGARWRLPTAEAMVALRVAIANGRWDELWPRLGPRQRRDRQDRRAARRRARPSVPPRPSAAPLTPAAATPRPPLVRQGTPTPNHPWRRPSIRHVPRSPTQM